MAEFDARPLAEIGENLAFKPTENTAKAYTLASLIDQRQMGKMELEAKKSEAADLGKVKEVLKGANLSTYEGKMKAGEQITKISPKLGMDFQKQTQEGRSTDTQFTAQQYELMAAKNDIVGGTVLQLKNQHDALAQQGKTEPEIQAAMTPHLMSGIKTLMDQKLPDGTPVLNDQDKQNLQQMFGNGYNGAAVDSLVMRSKQAREALKAKLDERKVDNAEAKSDEQERHNREMEGQGRTKIQRTANGGLTSATVDDLAEQVAAGDTSAIQGLSKQDKAAVRNRVADNHEIAGVTGADQAAKNAEFMGIKAGQRTLGQRQANIDMAVQEAQNIMPILREASKKVPRGKFTSWNQLFQIADGQTSNPELLQFAQAAKSFANIYTRATVPGASSVFDREEAVKHLPIYTSDESFQKVLDIMAQEMAAAKASPHQVRQDLSSSVTGSDRATLPTGGQPPSAPGAPASGGAPPSTGGGAPGAGAPATGAPAGQVIDWSQLK